jgi:tetratricopeptide (TPR) repeat protein
MRRNLSLLLLSLFVTLNLLAPQVSGQDRDPRRTIERYQSYLDRKPFNDRAFDQMVTAAVSINALDELIEGYRKRVEQGATLGPRVILARLLAKADEHQEAFDVLKQHLGTEGEGGDPRVLRIAGDLELERGNTKQAVALLDRAAAGTDERELLEDIHTMRGEAWLAAGDEDKAAAAFRDLAELEPGSFPLRLDAADALARHGLHEAALVQYQVAADLAKDDIPRRCRVLAEIGKLREALSEGEAALGAYREAIGLMARGHWLKNDLYARVLALHRRTGQLERLLTNAAADSAAAPGDLDAREFHARVLIAAERDEEARDVLRAATEEFPTDLSLGRQLIGVLYGLDDVDGVVAEYQRLLEEHPDELELYLELGQTFASAGRLEQAARQWRQTLQQRLDDPNLCIRLAGLYALYQQPEEAVALFEKAIELEPTELRHYSDLAAYLRAQERPEDAGDVIARAESSSAGDPGRIADVAGMWREHRDLDRARGAIDAALALQPDDPQLHYRLADLQLAQEQEEAAVETLHHVLHIADEGNLRRSASERLLRLFQRGERLNELVALEQAAIEADPTDPIPHVILGKAFVVMRLPDQAEEHYQRLLVLEPERDDARVALARLAENRSDFAGALAHYDALIEARPQARRRWLDSIARIHLARYDQDKAFECYQEILASSPDNPAAFREVATSYQRLGMIDEASDCLRQAVRLDPDDHRTRLRLADLYRQLGELRSAEREVLAAMESDEDRIVSDARTSYYELLSSAGRVNDEVKALRTRVEDNPYDIEAPLVLTDIYVRELEYELAIEVLDRLLGYQPDQTDLLLERGRLLGLLERYDEAIAVYERLWKMKGVDREDLALSIADAALEDGDRDKAAQVLATVANAGRVARLYRKKERWDEAIEVLERGLSRAPGDRRLLSSLADLHEARGDEDSAIAVLERAMELRGDSFSRLKQLGTLYNTVGKRDEAIACGRRLFLLIREVEEEEPDPDDEGGKPKAPTRRALSWWNRGRVSDVQSYFSGLGLNREFAEIGAEEVLLQATNHSLFTTVVSALQNLEGEGARTMELVEAVREATLRKQRLPEGYTAAGWSRSLDAQRVGLYRRDVPFAEQRLTALTAASDGGEATAVDYEEWARILDHLTRPKEKLDVLTMGVEHFPDSTSLRAGLASTLYAEKRYDQALPHYAALVELTLASPPDPADELFARNFSFKSSKFRILQKFPRHVRRRISSEDLRAFFDLTQSRPLNLSWGPGTQQFPAAARLAHARCLGKADDKAEAGRRLTAMAADAGDNLLELSTIAGALYALDLFEEAGEIYARLAKRERELSVHPVFGFNRSWARSFNSPMSRLARIRERTGDYVEAYHLLRTFGDAAAGELALNTGDCLPEARERYATLVAQERARLTGDEDEDTDAWRDACVRLAEIEQIDKRWDEALALYQKVADRRTDDFSILEQLAALHMRAGRVDDTIAVHRAIIARKRELNLRPLRAERPPGRVLTPIAPPKPQERNWAWSNLRSSYYARGPQPNFPYRENYVAILKLLLDRGRVEEATDVMRDLARTDVQTFSWLGYSLAEVIEQYQLGAKGIPILRLVHSHNSRYYSMTVQFAKALMAGQRFDEARRVLIKLRDSNSSRSYAGQQARTMLGTLDAREGVDSRKTLEELLAEVEADPKNVKVHMEYGRRLFEERRFEEALSQGLTAEELAPHKDEVEDFVIDLLQLVDHQGELETRLLDDLESVSDDQKRLQRAARVAEWMWQRGEKDRAGELLKEATRRSSRGYPYYTAAGFWLEKGDLERALSIVSAEFERTPKHRQYAIKRSKSAIERALGDVTPLLDDAWEDGYEKAAAEGDKADALRQLATPLRGDPRVAAEREALIARFSAEHEGLRGALYCAAVELAVGDLIAVEARLRAVAKPEGKTRFLYPLLVTLARTRDDLPKALGLLEELYAAGAGSESETVNTGVGNLSERNALRAEIGSLRHELGDPEGALAIWGEMFEEDDDAGKRSLTEIYRRHDLTQEAADSLRAYLDEVGERNENDVTLLGDLELELGHVEQAIATWKRSLVLAKGNEYQLTQLTSRLLDAYRRLGRIPEYAAELNEQVAADPNDIALAKRQVRVVAESGDRERAYGLLEQLGHLPDQDVIVLPALIQRAKLEGDVEGAIELSKQMLDTHQDPWRRRSTSRALAGLHFERDELELGLAALRAAFEDPESPEALLEIARRLQFGPDRQEEALDYYLRGLELLPDQGWQWSQVFWLMTRLERFDEQRDLILEKLADERLRAHTQVFVNAYEQLLDELPGEKERLATELEANPDDRVLRLLAAAEAKSDERFDEAIAHYHYLAERDPKDPEPLRFLLALLDGEDRLDEALAVLDQLIDLAELEEGVGGLKRSSGSVRNYRNQRSRLMLRQEDVDGAAEAITDDRGWRYRRPNVSRWRHGSLRREPNSERLDFFARLEDWKRVLELYASEPRVSTSQPWDKRWYEARLRSGEEEAVLEELWRRLADPAEPLFQGQNTRSTRFVSFGGSFGQSSMRYFGGSDFQSLLIQFHSERGTIDELSARVDAALEREPENGQLMGMQRRLIQRAERWELLLPEAEEKLAEDPWDENALVSVANLYLRLERYQDAIPLLEQAKRQYEAAALDAVTGWSWYHWEGNERPIRFNFASNNSNRSYGTNYNYYGGGSSGWGGPADNARRRLIVSLHKTGQRERALELEARELIGRHAQGLDGNEPDSALAPLFVEAELWEDAERIVLAQLAERLDKVKDPDPDEAQIERERLETMIYYRLADQWRKAGDEARVRTWAEKGLALSERAVARAEEKALEKGKDPSSSLYSNRASMRSKFLGDVEGARADLERYYELTDDPDHVTNTTVAWTWYRIEEPERALEVFKRERERRRFYWYSWSADLQLGLILSQAGAGQVPGDRELRTIRRSLFELSEHEFKDAAEALLGEGL